MTLLTGTTAPEPARRHMRRAMMGALMACVSIAAFVPMLGGTSSATPRIDKAVRTRANTPADGDFKAIFMPVFVSVSVVKAPTSRLVGAFKSLNQLFRIQNRLDEVVVALRISLDRAARAASAGDQVWLGRQEDASAKYALEADTLLKSLPPLNAEVESAFVADGFALKVTPQQFVAGRAYLAHHGLSPEFTRLLGVEAGVLRPQTSTEVRTLRTLLTDTTDFEASPVGATPASVDLATALDSLSSSEARTGAAFQSFANDVLRPTTTEQAQFRVLADGEPASWAETAEDEHHLTQFAEGTAAAAKTAGWFAGQLGNSAAAEGLKHLGEAGETGGEIAGLAFAAAAFAAATDAFGDVGGGETGYSEGDPHLLTLDGSLYDFQAAGEFTLVRSDDGRLDVQVRQQPEFAIASNAVAFDTAVAMMVDGTRVEVDPGLSGQILVDSRAVQLHGQTINHLPGGGELYYDPVGNVVVRWPDGSKAVVYAAGPGGYVVFSAAPDLVGRLRGLLTAVAEPEGEHGLPAGDEVLIGGNGERYVLNPSTTTGLRTLYRKFAPTWQITQKDSLFTYHKGKSTSSYILKGFPGSGYNLDSVPPKKLADLKNVCRKAGITNESLLDDCVFDSAATGGHSSTIAAVAARTENIVNTAGQGTIVPVPTPTTGSAPKTITLGTGNGLPVTAADPKTDTTYVAWTANSASMIDLCVVVAAGSCNGTGKPDQLVDPAAGTASSLQYSVPRIVVMPNSGQVVVVADIEGVSPSRYPNVDPPGYTGGEGDVAWASPAGGAGFGRPGEGLQAAGMFRATGVPPQAGAVALSPTVIAVFENDTYQRSFADFTLTNPAPATPANPSPSGGFGQASDVDSGQLAAEPVSSPAGDDLVVGIALGTGEPGTKCAKSLYTVGWGSSTGSLVQTSSTGALNDSATWPTKDFRLLSCAANSPTLAGGPSGIGELDQEGPGLSGGKNIELVYRRFDLATNSFGAPVTVSDETGVSSGGATLVSLSQDSTGAIYATWLDERGLVVGWSSDGGAEWSSPAVTGLGLNNIGTDFVVQGLGKGRFAVTYNRPVTNTTSRFYLTTLSYGALAKAKP